ncbi:T9SS type A sorting domain-containing protein [Mesonia sp. K7]|uniref:T9SS type A sorting domain-containing protein n=1 Tax=Mesonia sp. K7 TaxID=2218606 RepID=UPI0013144034|nr:T9SS type A sorting domain-containing protein [Mesonia sp. K7]
MKNYVFLFCSFLFIFHSYAQCLPLPVSVNSSICYDEPYLISDQSVATQLTVKDGNNNNVSVVWSTPNNLWLDANMTTSYNGGAVTEVYFMGEDSFEQYNYQANYNLPGCSQVITSYIYIYTEGVFYESCDVSQQTLADITFLNYSNGQISFYSDQAGTIPVTANTSISFHDTFYVTFGNNCSLIPLKVKHQTDSPEVEAIEKFCSQATWQAAGFNKQGDNLNEVHVVGENITWYSDAAGTQVISDPSAVTLSDNDTYYVSQTVNGCESELIPVNMLETTCGCIKNPEIEANGNQTADFDYTFHSENYGFQTVASCDENFDYTTATNLYTSVLGTNDDTTVNVSLTGQGDIAELANYNIYMSRTTPYAYSENAIRLNDYQGNIGKTTLVKEFIAGEVFSFDFAFIGSLNTNHMLSEQPSILVKVFDDNDKMIISECILPNVCQTSFSEWSCAKFNTEAYQGKGLTVEVMVTDCGLAGHYGTLYMDNLYVGEDNSSSCTNTVFGDVNLDAVTQAGSSYENCSLLSPIGTGLNCSTIASVVNPTYPLTVCGTYTVPTGATLQNIALNFTSTNNVTYSTNNVVVTSPGSFCVTLSQGDIPNAYGTIFIEAEAEFSKQCNSINGSLNVNLNTEAFKNCPVAACPTTVFTCSTSSPAVYDLTAKEIEILANIPIANQGDYSITYYTDQSGAENEDPNFLIANPTSYTPASAPSLAYARLDYNYIALGISPIANCYDLVALNFGIHPMFNIATPIEVEVCDDDGDGFYQFDLSIPTAQITANYPMIDVYYFETMADAQAEVNALPTMYTNVVAYTQTIYVKLKDTYAGCENIVPVNLIIDVPELLSAINPIPTDQENNVIVNANGSNLEVDLSWESGSNYCIDDEMFDLMMGASLSQLNLVQADITATTFTVQVNANTTYYWQVIPKSSQTTLGNTAPVWEFTTQSLITDSQVFSNLVYYTNNNRFYVKTSENTIEQLTFFNLQGKRIMSFPGNQSSEMVVDLAQLSSSVYLAQIKVEGNYKTVKLIKQ